MIMCFTCVIIAYIDISNLFTYSMCKRQTSTFVDGGKCGLNVGQNFAKQESLLMHKLEVLEMLAWLFVAEVSFVVKIM